MKKRNILMIGMGIILITVLGTIGITGLNEKEVTRVTKNGIVATIEDVRKDFARSIIKVNLQKEDGDSFEEDTRVGNIKISSKQGGLSYRTRVELSEDKKILTYTFMIDSEESTKLKGVEINLNHLVIAHEKQKTLEESIDKLYTLYPLENDYENDMLVEIADEVIKAEEVENKQGIIPVGEVENFKIIGVGFQAIEEKQVNQLTSNKEFLHIRTEFTGRRGSIESEARINGLHSELTGEEINSFYGYTTFESIREEGDVEKEIDETYFELTKTDKLKYIKPVISYTVKTEIDSNVWDLKVNLKENVKSISKDTDTVIQAEDVAIQLEKIEISSLGLSFEGALVDQEELQECISIPVTIFMEDGSKVDLVQETWATEKAFKQDYTIEGEELINIDAIKAIHIAKKKVAFKE